jgi:hypothetical protein
MVDGERKPRKEGDNDATPPLCALAVSADDAMDDCIADFVFNSNVLYCRPFSRVGLPVKEEQESLRTT